MGADTALLLEGYIFRIVTAERALTLNDGRILTYLDLGDPSGSPVVYFHGAPSGKLETEFFVLDERARRAGVRLIVADRPGVGGSTGVASRTLLDGGSMLSPSRTPSASSASLFWATRSGRLSRSQLVMWAAGA